MSLTVRTPNFTFESTVPHWAPSFEFAHMWNGTSVIPSQVEPFVVKVFTKARELVKDEDLRREMDLFVSQERQHSVAHVRFNRMLRTHYPKIQECEERLRNELNDFLENRSLKFQLAFVEGFESSFGVLNSRIWLDDLEEYREGADPEVLAFWDWHMAEEYEHREVALKVFMHIYGRGPINWVVNGYFYRLFGARFAMKYLGKHTARSMYKLLSQDWKSMTPEEVAASQARLAALGGKVKQLIQRRMVSLAWPFYDPATKPEPRGFRAAIARVMGDGPFARRKAAA